MVVVGMNSMPLKIIGKIICLWVKGLFGLSKDLGPKRCLNTCKRSQRKQGWRTPKFLVRPKKGPTMLKSGNSWNLVSFPASSTKGGWEGRVEGFGIRLGRGTSYLIIWSYIQNQPTSWLKLIMHTFGVGTSHGQPWTHLTHHGPDSGEATTLPHIVFSASFHRTCIRMTFFPRTPKVKSQNCPNLNSLDFGRS